MPIRPSPSSAVFGWLLLVAGIVYILFGTYGALSATAGSLPRVVVGLVAVVVGSSVIRWAKRSTGP
jgi:xanthine/uracil permease